MRTTRVGGEIVAQLAKMTETPVSTILTIGPRPPRGHCDGSLAFLSNSSRLSIRCIELSPRTHSYHSPYGHPSQGFINE